MLGGIKLLLAGAVVALGMTIAIAAAGADLHITVERAGAITASSLGALTFRSPLATVTCNLSLTGSLERAAGLEGYGGSVSRASVSACSGGTVTTRTETPWDVIYDRPLGTLPRLTELRVGLYNVDLLFDVNVFGIHARCETIGHFGTLTTLTAEGESFRTGLSTISATDQRWRVYEELDTSGFCPSGEELSASGRLQINPNLIMPFPDRLDVETPSPPIIYAGSETRTITFLNPGIGNVTARRVRMRLNTRFRIPTGGNGCLTQPGETAKTIAGNGRCSVRVEYTNPVNGRIAWWDVLEIFGDPGETLLGHALVRFEP